MKLNLQQLMRSSCYHRALNAGHLCGTGDCVEVPDDFDLGDCSVERIEPAEVRPLMPMPPEAWPWWVKKLAERKQIGEKGIGDTVQRLLGNVGGEQFKIGFKLLTGLDCGCAARQDNLNELYPYSSASSARS